MFYLFVVVMSMEFLIILASTPKDLDILIISFEQSEETYNSILCPILNTLYISSQDVPDSFFIKLNKGGTGKRLSFII